MVWNCLVLYEEIPGSAPWLLRAVLPRPLRTEGDKSRVGEHVRCVYADGVLVKRIVAVEPRCLLQFDVVEQDLGIEGCLRAQGGAYRFVPCGDGTDVVLITDYLAYLHPSRLWRPLEAVLVRRLHRHILAGVRAALAPAVASARVEAAPSRRGAPGGSGWTASPSRSHR